MVRPICKDIIFLQKKSVDATPADRQVITDLIETLNAHENECIGMAANMIGINKRIIICKLGFINVIMVNPVITKKEGEYRAEEACLSISGPRPAKRFKKITVEFLNSDFEPQVMELEGLSAQIVQHECDHLEGILI